MLRYVPDENLHFENLQFTIYKVAIIPINAYGIEIWGHRLSNLKAELRTTHAVCRKGVLDVYSSIPNETLCVLTKQVPLHLELQQMKAHMEVL